MVDANTLLLIHGGEIIDNSSYGLTVENSGVVVSDIQSKFSGKSLCFGGYPAALTIKSDLFNFGAGDFTVDWWEYCVGLSASRFSLSINGGCGGLCAGGGGDVNCLYVSSTGTSWDMFGGVPAFNKTPNEWVHWAVVRSGNTMYTFRNGALYWSGAISGSIFWNGAGLVIGSFLYDANHYFNGYMEEFRVSNVARWTADFTPAAEPYRNALLLLRGDDISDSSEYKRAINNYGVTVSNAQSKFTEKSLYFDGNSYLTVEVPHEGDMTIDCWVYFEDYGSTYPTAFNWLSGAYRGDYVHIMPDTMVFGTTSATGTDDSPQTSPLPANEWVHLAMVRTGDTLKCYVNGVEKVAISGRITSNGTLWLGMLQQAPSITQFKGYIDEFCISSGALWTSNFDPSGTPHYPSDLAKPVDGAGVSIVKAMSYGLTEGKTLIDGTAYPIRKGKTLVDGTAYDVQFDQINYVEYIQSDGSQWIDTGFMPNSTTGVICDFQLVSTVGWQTIFGAWSLSNGSYVNAFAFLSTSSGAFRSNYGIEALQAPCPTALTERHIVKKIRTSCTVDDGTTVSHVNTVFNADENLFLFSGNTDGSPTEKAITRIYSCQVYDNDVLIRDYWPCLDENGVACMYDKVNEEYVYNAGSGVFSI